MTAPRALLIAAVLWVPLLLVRPPARQQELRVMITARNMVENRDWLHPEFQNRPRYRKPPLAYWLAASAMALTGQTDCPAIARIPFLLLAIGILMLTMRMAGPAIGPMATLLLIFSAGMAWFTPLAETDLPLLFGILLALWSWQRENGWICGIGMAVGFLAKGPAGIAIPIFTMLALTPTDARTPGFWIKALLPALGSAAGWMLFLRLDPMAREALSSELLATFVDTEHENPWLYYLYTLPWLMLPGAVLFLRGKGWRTSAQRAYADTNPAARSTEGRTTSLRFPVTWLLVTLILLTLTVSKQRHYALMLLPPAAWCLAGLRSRFQPRPFPLLLGLSAAISMALCAGIWFSEDAVNARFLKQASAATPRENTLHVVGINSAVFDLYFGRHVENIDSAAAALGRAGPGDSVTVVQKRDRWDAEQTGINPVSSGDDETWIRRHYRL